MRQNRFILNKKAYESEDIVSYYDSLNFLYKPEETILDILSGHMREMRMLDIGVGAGRTTQHFASIAKEYVGIDYSENMIDICRKKYSHQFKNVSFEVCDVKSMGIFADNSFDLILFSFNSIDSLTHDDRLSALHEIKRVCATPVNRKIRTASSGKYELCSPTASRTDGFGIGNEFIPINKFRVLKCNLVIKK
jgi:ubiquinone/menaquinone biosynthesis C-methylase UbiE